EAGDNVAHPLQGTDDVAQAEIGRHARDRKESVNAQPVVDGDADQARARERASLMDRRVLAPEDEATAVDPHQDRAALPIFRRPDVEPQIVGIAAAAAADERDDIDARKVLDLVGRAGPRLGRVENTVPGPSRPRLPEPVLAGRSLLI